MNLRGFHWWRQGECFTAVVQLRTLGEVSSCVSNSYWKLYRRTQLNVISITYKTLQSDKPNYLDDLLHIQGHRNTRFSDVVTLQRPSDCSRLKLTDRSFTHLAPVLWNNLPKQLRQLTPHPDLSIFTAPLCLYLHLSFMRNSKRSYSTDHFLHSLLHYPPHVSSLVQRHGNFPSSLIHFDCYHSPSQHALLVSENKPPSVIAVLVSFYGHSESSHPLFFIFHSTWGN